MICLGFFFKSCWTFPKLLKCELLIFISLGKFLDKIPKILLSFYSVFLYLETPITCTFDLFSVSHLLLCHVGVFLFFSLFDSVWLFLLTYFIH